MDNFFLLCYFEFDRGSCNSYFDYEFDRGSCNSMSQPFPGASIQKVSLVILFVTCIMRFFLFGIEKGDM